MTDLPDRSQAVTVAYVHPNEVAYSWHHSMVQLVGWDMANHGRILAGGYIAMRCGTNGLVEARNQAVRNFLEDDASDWLFWIDTDMGFAPDTVDRLLEVADPVHRPVVGGLCFTQNEKAEDGLGGWRCRAIPTIFDWMRLDEAGQEKMGFAVRWDYPANTLIRVGGTGAACVLVHRSVFEQIQQAHGRVWYDRVPNTTTGQLIGEDLSFCLRAGALQIPMYVHTGVKTTHLKTVWLADEDYQQQRVTQALLEQQPDVSGLKRVSTREQAWTFNLLPEALAELDIAAKSVLHVGAHRGEEVPVYRKCGFEQITLVEPDPDNAAFLRAEFPDCAVVECAVGEEPGTATLHRAVDSVFTGLKANAGMPTVGQVDVAVRPLRDVQSEHVANVLVVDTQGTELEVLASADLSGVDLLVVETQELSRDLYAAYWPDAVEALGKVGFVPGIRWEHEAHFADTLFVRRSDG